MEEFTNAIKTSDAAEISVDQFRHQYEAVGVNPMIAESAAQAKFDKQNGRQVDEIDQQVLDFADQILNQP